LLLGPWYITWSALGGMSGWRSEFLCPEMPLGNSEEWRTIYFKGVWLLPELEKIHFIAFLEPHQVDNLRSFS
jgi:hypothetical protein